MRAKTIHDVQDRIRTAIDSLASIHQLPADGMTIDAAALIHRQSMASIQRLMKFDNSMVLLRDIATDF